MPNTNTMLSVLIEEAAIVNADYPIELIRVMRHLAMYHDDFSYAVENIVLLGNTNHEVLFDDKVSPAQASMMRAELKQMMKVWAPGGENGLINDLLTQMVVAGALSAEAVPDKRLSQVEQIVMVDVDTIQFVFKVSTGKYEPWQRPLLSALSPRQLSQGGAVKLNPTTYKYIPLRRYSEAPYGIPPFLAALDSIKVNNDMICGLKKIIQKLGVFGFLQVLVRAPKQNVETKETFEGYQARLKAYLDNWVTPEIEKALKNGFISGFMDTTEFEMKDTLTNVEGVKDIFEVIAVRTHSGLKQDPMMLGRPYTTTETLGRVILSKLAKQVTNYQKNVATFLEQAYRLHLQLRGYAFQFLDVVFEAPMVNDQVKDEQAYMTKINNVNILYDRGIIDQTTAAQLLGYEKPDQPKPRVPTATSGQKTAGTANPTSKKDPDPNPAKAKNLRELAQELGIDYDEFDYGLGET